MSAARAAIESLPANVKLSVWPRLAGGYHVSVNVVQTSQVPPLLFVGHVEDLGSLDLEVSNLLAAMRDHYKAPRRD